MKLLDKETYERNLKELMNTSIGGLPPKPIEKQESIVINQQPVETLTTPTSVNPQPQINIINEPQTQPSSLFLQKTGNAQNSLTKLGVLVGVGGAIFGYLYSTTPSIQLETNTLLSKLSTFISNPIIMGSILLGVLICSMGLIKK